MGDTEALRSCALAPFVQGNPSLSVEALAALPERARMAEVHHEICTALTVLRSNVELVRIDMRDGSRAGEVVAVYAHLVELDAAVDRLQRIAQVIRAWPRDK